MKNFFLLLAAIFLVSLESFSQISQGQWMLGGSVHIDGHNSRVETGRTGSSFDADLDVRGGYFVTNNIAIGLSQGYSYERRTSEYSIRWAGAEDFEDNIYKSTSHSFLTSPFVRVYKQLFDSRVYLFGQGSVNFRHARRIGGSETFIDNTLVEQSSHRAVANSIGAFIVPGVNFFIHDKIALEVLFGGLSSHYERSTFSGDNIEETRRDFYYNFDLNLRLNFGLVFFL
ncbi:hypothetical protein RCC89_16010 [Cytophagaceae bacterium ABcell3]|nr:hypothetical protein RCC89_16010 [Cytophagaceae bacterium ABcell3]